MTSKTADIIIDAQLAAAKATWNDAIEAAAISAESVMGSPWHTSTSREAARRIRELKRTP